MYAVSSGMFKHVARGGRDEQQRLSVGGCRWSPGGRRSAPGEEVVSGCY